MDEKYETLFDDESEWEYKLWMKYGRKVEGIRC